jgi:hypothetical protein
VLAYQGVPIALALAVSPKIKVLQHANGRLSALRELEV